MKCPDCSGKLKDWGVRKKLCLECGSEFRNSDLYSSPKKSRSKHRTTRKIADKHEKRAAKKFRARQTIASGQTELEKADLKNQVARFECKTTKNKSYGLKLSELEKLSSQTELSKIPVFVIELDRDGTRQEFSVVPSEWMDHLLTLWSTYDKDN